MVSRRKIFIASIIISLVLGIFLTPAIPMVYGLGIWFVIWAAKGGMSYGNPHRKRAIENRRFVMNRDYYSQANEKELDMSIMKNRTEAYLMLLGLAQIVFAFILFEFWNGF